MSRIVVPIPPQRHTNRQKVNAWLSASHFPGSQHVITQRLGEALPVVRTREAQTINLLPTSTGAQESGVAHEPITNPIRFSHPIASMAATSDCVSWIRMGLSGSMS